MERIASSLFYFMCFVVPFLACTPEAPKPEAHIIGDLTSRRTEHLKTKINTIPYSSGTHHLIVQGSKLSSLTDAEEQAIRSSYLENYRIVILEASEAHLNTFRSIIQDNVGISHPDKVMDVVVARRDPDSGLPATTFYIDATTKAPSQPDDPTSARDSDAIEDELLANGVVEELLAPREAMSLLGAPERLMLAQSASPSIPWTANVHNALVTVAGAGIFYTDFQFWGVRQCSTGDAIYIGIASNNWTPGTAYEWAMLGQGIEKSSDAKQLTVKNWQLGSDISSLPGSCGQGGSAYIDTACQIADYPTYYTVTMNPTGTSLANVVQTNTGPAISGGPTSLETSGFNFSLGGNIGGGAGGPSAGVTAGATWTSSTSVSISSTQMYKRNLSPSYSPGPNNLGTTATTPGIGAGWTIQYCTQPTSSPAGCGSPEVGVASHNNCNQMLGVPVPGQLSSDSVSSMQEAVYWTDSSPIGSSSSTFPVKVSFETFLQTTSLKVWNKAGVADNPPPYGGNCVGYLGLGPECECVPTAPSSRGITTSATYNVPVPPPCPPPVLTLNKVIINSTGANTPNQWTLSAENGNTGLIDITGTSGVTGTISAGEYKLTESGPSGYRQTEILCRDQTRGPITSNNGSGYLFTFFDGDIVTCTFYNQANP